MALEEQLGPVPNARPFVYEGGPGAPGSTMEGLPDPWTIYSVDGQLYLVWEAPVGNGRTVPVCWRIEETEFADWFSTQPQGYISRTMTTAQFNAAGCIDAGDWEDIPDDMDFWADPLEGWLDALEENVIVAPWLADPEVAALAAAAYVEGTSLSQAQLAGTNWWQTHNAAERAWLLLYSSDPSSALQQQEDYRLGALDALEAAGVSNAEELTITVDGVTMSLADWMGDQLTFGHWSQSYLGRQISYLADPTMHDRLDDELQQVLTGTLSTLDTTRDQEDRVRQLFRTWLGPLHGMPDEATIERWAGRLRNDPDAETALTDFLSGQRMALFPQYTDPTLTYEDVAGIWRNLGYQSWGQQMDETDPFFIKLVRTNDSQEAERMLRQEGLQRGVEKVFDSAVSAFAAAFGGPIVRAG